MDVHGTGGRRGGRRARRQGEQQGLEEVIWKPPGDMHGGVAYRARHACSSRCAARAEQGVRTVRRDALTNDVEDIGMADIALLVVARVHTAHTDISRRDASLREAHTHEWISRGTTEEESAGESRA